MLCFYQFEIFTLKNAALVLLLTLVWSVVWFMFVEGSSDEWWVVCLIAGKPRRFFYIQLMTTAAKREIGWRKKKLKHKEENESMRLTGYQKDHRTTKHNHWEQRLRLGQFVSYQAGPVFIKVFIWNVTYESWAFTKWENYEIKMVGGATQRFGLVFV